jgi:hypothetical protein
VTRHGSAGSRCSSPQGKLGADASNETARYGRPNEHWVALYASYITAGGELGDGAAIVPCGSLCSGHILKNSA